MSTDAVLDKRLKGKDLVTVGIYTAIYFVLTMVAGFLGFIPVFIPLLAAIVPIIGGIPFMLFVTKVHKFGMISLFSTINGILMSIAGMGPYVVLTGIISGLLADFLMKSGSYKSVQKSILGHAVFCLWVFGNFMPFYVGRDAQFAMITEGYGKQYAQSLETLMPTNLMPVMIIACIVFGLIGGMIGKAVNKKHFERSGIA